MTINFGKRGIFMKCKKIMGIGLVGALLIGMFGVIQVSASNAKNEMEQSVPCEKEVLSRDSEAGLEISMDGEKWVSLSEYENESVLMEWWTSEEYELWMAQEKAELESLIGTGGWYDKSGYHEWTQESVDAQIAEYEEVLKEIKAGILYSKNSEDGIGYSQIPPNSEDIESVYSVDFIRADGSVLHIGNYDTQKKLEDAIDKARQNGQVTQEEIDTLAYQ